MRFLSFLIERENPGKNYKLLHEARASDRLRFTACFWDAGDLPHRLEIHSHQPDGTVRVVGTFDKRCNRGTGLFVVEGLLEPLRLGGWHRLQLQLDGAFVGVSRQIFVLGPRRTRGRYLGRTPPAAASDSRSMDEGEREERPAATGEDRRRRGR